MKEAMEKKKQRELERERALNNVRAQPMVTPGRFSAATPKRTPRRLGIWPFSFCLWADLCWCIDLKFKWNKRYTVINTQKRGKYYCTLIHLASTNENLWKPTTKKKKKDFIMDIIRVSQRETPPKKRISLEWLCV